MAASARRWRDIIEVHPAADLFPMMSDAEIDELAADIDKNRLRSGITIWINADPKEMPRRSLPYDMEDPISWFHVLRQKKGFEVFLLDGRNRIAALEKNIELSRGVDPDLSLERAFDYHGGDPDHPVVLFHRDLDPYAYVASANLHRRHLTAEQKRDVIAKVLKANPEKSDRQIAETVKVSPTTVGKVRSELEQAGDVSRLDTRTDTKGRQQPMRRRDAPPEVPAETQAEAQPEAQAAAQATEGPGVGEDGDVSAADAPSPTTASSRRDLADKLRDLNLSIAPQKKDIRMLLRREERARIASVYLQVLGFKIGPDDLLKLPST